MKYYPNSHLQTSWKKEQFDPLISISAAYNMNFIRQHVKKNPEKYNDLRKNLRAARISTPYPVYVNSGFLYAAAAVVVSYISFCILLQQGIFPFPDLLQRYIPIPGLLIVIPLLIGYAVFKLWLLYPKFTAASRRTRIDVVLPHAAAFCYGMGKGGTPIYEIFKELAKNHHIYGEVSREALYVVRDVELLGSDMITAIKNAARTTPSEKFREFLENLVPMVEGGSNAHQYFSVKMHQYFEHAKKTQEMFLKTLELLCEVYVVAFVAIPIFLLVTLVTIGFLQASQAPYIFQALFIGLPVGSIAMIIIIDAISPKEDLDMKQVHNTSLKRPVFVAREIINETEYTHKLNKYERKKKFNKFFKYAQNPASIFYEEPLRAMFIGIPLMFIPFLLPGMGLDKQLLLATVLVMIPLSIAYELKMRRLTKMDRAIPDFLRRLAEMNEIGITLKHAIGLVLKSDMGHLSREVRRMWLDMEWGCEMKEALVRFENRIGTPALRRAITLIVKASEVSNDTKYVLLIAADDAENTIRLRRDRFDTAFVYLATIYIAFGTFIYVCYSFSMQFMPSITALGTHAMATAKINSTMFATCGILGFFSGLITGQMAEGRLLFGLKHSVIFLLVTYAAFTILMGY